MRIVEFEILGEDHVGAAQNNPTVPGSLRGTAASIGRLRAQVRDNSRWESRPNYKDFRRKCSLVTSNEVMPVVNERRRGNENEVVTRSGKVDLVLEKEPDYGDGPAYWSRNSPSTQWQSQLPERADTDVYTYSLGATLRPPAA